MSLFETKYKWNWNYVRQYYYFINENKKIMAFFMLFKWIHFRLQFQKRNSHNKINKSVLLWKWKLNKKNSYIFEIKFIKLLAMHGYIVRMVSMHILYRVGNTRPYPTIPYHYNAGFVRWQKQPVELVLEHTFTSVRHSLYGNDKEKFNLFSTWQKCRIPI